MYVRIAESPKTENYLKQLQIFRQRKLSSFYSIAYETQLTTA